MIHPLLPLPSLTIAVAIAIIMELPHVFLKKPRHLVIHVGISQKVMPLGLWQPLFGVSGFSWWMGADSGIKSLPLRHGITQSITHYPARGSGG